MRGRWVAIAITCAASAATAAPLQVKAADPAAGLPAISADGALIALPVTSDESWAPRGGDVTSQHAVTIRVVAVAPGGAAPQEFAVACASAGPEAHACPPAKVTRARLAALSALFAKRGFRSLDVAEATLVAAAAPPSNDEAPPAVDQLTVGDVIFDVTSSDEAVVLEGKRGGQVVARAAIAAPVDDAAVGDQTARVAQVAAIDGAIAVQVVFEIAGSGVRSSSETRWTLVHVDGSDARDLAAPALDPCPAHATARGGAPPLHYHAWCEDSGQTRVGAELRWSAAGMLVLRQSYDELGQQDGEYAAYDDAGRATQTGTYAHGKQVGAWTTTDRGGKATTVQYADGERVLSPAEALAAARAAFAKTPPKQALARRAEAIVKRHCDALAATYALTQRFYAKCFGPEPERYICPTDELARTQAAIDAGLARGDAILAELKPLNTAAYGGDDYDGYTKLLDAAMHADCPAPPPHPWYSGAVHVDP